jgi:hypothetical protein
MKKKKGTKKVAFISVQSDAVRSGEGVKVDVSQGVSKVPTTTGEKLQFMYLTQQKNHRDMMQSIETMSESFSKAISDDPAKLGEMMATVARMVNDQADRYQQSLGIIDSRLGQLTSAMLLVVEHLERPSVWRRIWNSIFGTEKK